ncbi:NmrA family NAD(P)-binding protein [Mycolicibacterium psychrotolerans]|uniref:NmrA family NAD(P)-binding protein n=1 Tax=Mycolicibacterium psychrotolerans TaxID=216929 RepID=UPI0021F371F8|nr:NAD(P)H-binding protein [Mycolicibacterium psychrotolerans]
MSDSVLVTGATGNTGAHVVAGLRERSHRARAASRHPDSADADAVAFDWSDDATFAPALTGVRAVYVVAPAGAADRPFLETAAARGVRRVVLLSSSAVARGEPGLGEIHDLVTDLFAEPTVLRPSWFMQNFVGDHPLAETIRRAREIVTATGDGRLGFIDAADIAATAVEALTATEPVGGDLVLTGPESLSYPEAAAIVSEVLGRPVRHVDVSTAELARRLTAAGYSAEFSSMLAALDERIRTGEQDLVTTTVRDITGRTPTSLRHFLAGHASRLASSP